jgi:hypothetical protein
MPPLTSTPADHKYVRQEVNDLIPLWTIVRDAVKGQHQIKKKTTAYLPKPNAADTSKENTTRYNDYLQRAVFYGVTGRTLRGFTGHVFAKLPKIDLSPQLEPLRENVDGLGVPLGQQAQKVLARLLMLGRGGLLADFPILTAAATRAQLQNGSVAPTITFFEPEDIINWRIKTVGTKQMLTLLVLHELQEEDNVSFERELVDHWRVLRLDENGNYTVQVISEKTGPGEIMTPKNSSGAPFKEIPFVFLGSENNDPSPDDPPLFDMATLNIAHYRNSADYEESSFLVGQPTPVVSGLTKDWATDILGGIITLGSRAVIPLPVGGKAELLQAGPNSMPKEAMEHKEKQLVALGARIVEARVIQRTATESGQDEEVETSILINTSRNVSLGYGKALVWAGQFVGATGESTVELNTDFSMARMSVEERQELIAEWQGEAISFSEMRRGLTIQGTATLTDDEARAEIAAHPPPKQEPAGFGEVAGQRAPQPNSSGDNRGGAE